MTEISKLESQAIWPRVCCRNFYRSSGKRQAAWLRRYLSSIGAANWSSISTHMSREEACLLFWTAAALPPGSVVVEFGSYLGSSSVVLAAGVGRKGGRLFCVDTWQNQTMPEGTRDTLKEFRENTEAVRPAIAELRQFSTATTLSQIGAPAALGFIDADHSYEAVKADIKTMLPLLSEQGQLLFHDTTSFSGVSRAVGELLATGEWKLAGLAHSLAWLKRADWQVKEWVGHV